jgi:hypothetical protein
MMSFIIVKTRVPRGIFDGISAKLECTLDLLGNPVEPMSINPAVTGRVPLSDSGMPFDHGVFATLGKTAGARPDPIE